jgi:hypothetical protein
VVGSCEQDNETSGSIRANIPWPVERQSTFKDGLGSMEFVITYAFGQRKCSALW